MFNSKYSKLLTIILIVAIIAIIGLLIFVTFDWYTAYTTGADTDDMIDQFDDYINNVQTNRPVYNGNANTNNNVDNNIEEPNIDINNTVIPGNTTNEGNTTTGGNTNQGNNNVLTYKGFKVVGKIEIPKTDVEYPLLEKVTPKSIEASIGVLYGPGVNEIGNTVLIGHNFRNGTFFSNNKKLSNGDKIYITDMQGKKVTYTIYKKYTTDTNDFDYATRDTNGKREISLSTCTDDTKNRLIIWAKED